MKLFYVHDPMCSWCWAFRPVLQEVLSKLPKTLEVTYLVGGLAPDSQEPMGEETQVMIQHHWRTILNRVPGTQFNFDFWTLNTPKRSTYPACRSVLAAKVQDPSKEDAMIHAIQRAYYLDARNPSNSGTLIMCAQSIGLDAEQFQNDLFSPKIQTLLMNDLQKVSVMPIRGFPSLVLEKDNVYHAIAVDYNNAASIVDNIQ